MGYQPHYIERVFFFGSAINAAPVFTDATFLLNGPPTDIFAMPSFHQTVLAILL
jgi:hypothetical protein